LIFVLGTPDILEIQWFNLHRDPKKKLKNGTP
jgi:hypothetical protein